ncbi:Glycosyl transferase family group 2 [Halogeometricum rufum]|uniref:Glycosyl transferase family group 2 n=1 Tax=Halogeometricum rufum TaxID=553469 RepID=A0A1I6I4Q6_9EURY|nr:glycosyltransferase family 2 protein [Halogeometricum rufum]SFR61614.1 Glycosyl transferase family group 2 [Halogeometricum rufum]
MFEVRAELVVTVLLWVSLGFYGFSALWWLFETTVLSRGWRTDDRLVWGPEDVQVRILTVDAEDVVQATVDAIPEEIPDVHVVAERPMTVAGATVHVVPSAFTCEATNKGRAVEWARRHVACDREYVLYLDEDTLMTGFDGVPDADVVQFSELPMFTGSRLAYLCEVFRMGYQYEQRGFHRLRYPLYAWGGAVAVRRSVEARVTWDAKTLTEDTNFVWRAARDVRATYALVDAKFRNQAPPSVRALIRQRRRWISGSIDDDSHLAWRYRPLYATRIVAWAFSPLVPLLVVAAYVHPGTAPNFALYAGIATGFGLLLYVYTALGAVSYGKSLPLALLYVALTPVAVVVHAAGAMWGVLSPVRTFEVTEKVVPERLVDAHPEMEPGDLTDEDGRRSVDQTAD